MRTEYPELDFKAELDIIILSHVALLLLEKSSISYFCATCNTVEPG